jgi:hypothetical protein
MGKLEPSVLVIPSHPRTESVPVEIEYLQEDIVGDLVGGVVDCHGWAQGK